MDGYLQILNYVCLWCNRHGIKTKDIQQGLEEGKSLEVSPTFIQVRPRRNPSSISILRNISITFPDGVNLILQESGVEEVVTLLNVYQSRHQSKGGEQSCSL